MATLLILSDDGKTEIVRVLLGRIDPRRATAVVWTALAGEPVPRKTRRDKGTKRGPRKPKIQQLAA